MVSHREDGTVLHSGNMTGSQLIMVLLYAGSKTGREKMIKGWGWGKDLSINNPAIQEAISKMNKEDIALIQKIWDATNKLSKPLSDVYRRTTNNILKNIEAESFDTPHGKLTGGYIPMVYDYDIPGGSEDFNMQQLRRKAEAQAESDFSGLEDQLRDVSASSVNERTKFYAPVDFSMSIIDRHFNEVTHYIALREAVRDVATVVNDPRYRRAVTQTFGKEHYALYRNWLKDIARDGNINLHVSEIDKLAHYLNGSLTVGYMGAKLSTFYLQLLGLSNASAEVGGKNMAGAFIDIMKSDKSMSDTWKWIITVSTVMRNRLHTMDREMQNVMQIYGEGDSLLAKFRRNALMHIAYMQTFVIDFPTWVAAYKKGLHEFE